MQNNLFLSALHQEPAKCTILCSATMIIRLSCSTACEANPPVKCKLVFSTVTLGSKIRRKKNCRRYSGLCNPSSLHERWQSKIKIFRYDDTAQCIVRFCVQGSHQLNHISNLHLLLLLDAHAQITPFIVLVCFKRKRCIR